MLTNWLNALFAMLLAWLWTPYDVPYYSACMGALFLLALITFTLEDIRRGRKD